MIPLKLHIKNFLSYGSEIQTIDFSHYPLICLSGKNGHGKSALLDAFTWAIWGQARKLPGTAKPDQGLLRLGQTQMMVSLDFMFNNQRYRIRREFAQTYGKPLANLDFALLNDDDSVISLTDKTIRATQTKIEQTLRLSYDSFTNSAFLRQGHADEFTKKPAKERKKILADILGLGHYESLKKLATDKVRDAQAQRDSLQSFQEKIIKELEQTPIIIANITELGSKLDHIALKNKDFTQKLSDIAHERLELTQEQKKQELCSYKYTQLLHEQEQLQIQLRSLFNEWRSINRTYKTLVDHKDLDAQKKVIIATINLAQEKLQKKLELKEIYLKIKEESQAHAQLLESQHAKIVYEQQLALERMRNDQKNISANLHNLQEFIQKKELERTTLLHEQEILTKNSIYKKFPDIDHLHKKIITIEKSFDRRKEYYQKFIALGNLTTNELRHLDQRTDFSLNDDNPSCPLCEQNLSASRKRFLKKKFDEDTIVLTRRLNRLKIIINKLKNVLVQQHEELVQFKKDREEYQLTENKLNDISQKIELINKEIANTVSQRNVHLEHNNNLQKTIELNQQKLVQLDQTQQTRFLHDQTHKEFIQKLSTIEQEAKLLLYDQKAHKEAQDKLVGIEQLLLESSHIREQVSLQEQRKQEILKLCAQLKLLKKEVVSKKNELKLFEKIALIALNLNNKEKELNQEITLLTQEKELLLEHKGSLERQRETLDRLTHEHKNQLKIITELSTTIEEYQAIATATGKDGIQALLIEEAIPEIEQEANVLLSKLTNNQAQIFIESLRDLKKGGTKETLDIKISDSVGLRPYELFSGGEAFRIDFALRIAISKLLARRAGTSLELLVIDEGFGSQDDEGLSHLMDAIYTIQDDFSKVIIVSHLTEMKDQFPVHFLVEKGPQGSLVRVMEQG